MYTCREELRARLNDGEYTNWLKAGRCLLILKSGLLPFASQHMREFHGALLRGDPLLRRRCETDACRPRGNKMLTVDLSVCVSGSDRLDGLKFDAVHESATADHPISQWEAELLQERLQELLHVDDDDAKTRVR
ncbi:hypothetical protein F2P81_000936 [Scophthalmus maximus]|uniref:Uncharacterized protein n=1 Tax=Scophthalmus maximus TaxID=52904 RepID=A0A6A4TMD0_SCOMX|nr:hypothetical protein F2P81_000936 [Scophthalmus maximus]